MTENVNCAVCLVAKVHRMLARADMHFADPEQAATYAMHDYGTSGEVKPALFQVDGTSLCAAHAYNKLSHYEMAEDD